MLIDKFPYFGSSFLSTISDDNLYLAKGWTTKDSLLIIWKSNLSNKVKRNFLQCVVVSIQVYGCTA